MRLRVKTHHSSGLVYSTGLWDTPSLEGTKIIAVGTRIETGQLHRVQRQPAYFYDARLKHTHES